MINDIQGVFRCLEKGAGLLVAQRPDNKIITIRIGDLNGGHFALVPQN